MAFKSQLHRMQDINLATLIRDQMTAVSGKIPPSKIRDFRECELPSKNKDKL